MATKKKTGMSEERKRMDSALLTEVENMRRATLAELREKYQELFKEETRSRHRGHLFRRIAWRLQALAEGDLPERARRRAQQIAQDADLRMVGPRDFLILEGARVTPRTRAAVAGTRTAASLCPALY
jgi:hypothetical protein